MYLEVYMRIKLELDPETTEKLVEAAVREKRPAAWQAEVMLRTALGLPFPLPKPHQPTPPQPVPQGLREVSVS
jgi:hypothetical protein